MPFNMKKSVMTAVLCALVATSGALSTLASEQQESFPSRLDHLESDILTAGQQLVVPDYRELKGIEPVALEADIKKEIIKREKKKKKEKIKKKRKSKVGKSDESTDESSDESTDETDDERCNEAIQKYVTKINTETNGTVSREWLESLLYNGTWFEGDPKNLETFFTPLTVGLPENNGRTADDFHPLWWSGFNMQNESVAELWTEMVHPGGWYSDSLTLAGSTLHATLRELCKVKSQVVHPDVWSEYGAAFTSTALPRMFTWSKANDVHLPLVFVDGYPDGPDDRGYTINGTYFYTSEVDTVVRLCNSTFHPEDPTATDLVPGGCLPSVTELMIYVMHTDTKICEDHEAILEEMHPNVFTKMTCKTVGDLGTYPLPDLTKSSDNSGDSGESDESSDESTDETDDERCNEAIQKYVTKINTETNGTVSREWLESLLYNGTWFEGDPKNLETFFTPLTVGLPENNGRTADDFHPLWWSGFNMQNESVAELWTEMVHPGGWYSDSLTLAGSTLHATLRELCKVKSQVVHPDVWSEYGAAFTSTALPRMFTWSKANDVHLPLVFVDGYPDGPDDRGYTINGTYFYTSEVDTVVRLCNSTFHPEDPTATDLVPGGCLPSVTELMIYVMHTDTKICEDHEAILEEMHPNVFTKMTCKTVGDLGTYPLPDLTKSSLC